MAKANPKSVSEKPSTPSENAPVTEHETAPTVPAEPSNDDDLQKVKEALGARGIPQQDYDTWVDSLRAMRPSIFDSPNSADAKALQRFLAFKRDFGEVNEASLLEWLTCNTDGNNAVTLDAEQEKRYRSSKLELLNQRGEFIVAVSRHARRQPATKSEPMITANTPGDTDISDNSPFWRGETATAAELRDDTVPLTADQVDLYRNHCIMLVGPDGEAIDVVGCTADGDGSDKIEDVQRVLYFLECVLANQIGGLELTKEATLGLSDVIMYARESLE